MNYKNRKMGRVLVSHITPSLVSKELQQEYIPDEAYEEDEGFMTIIEEARDEFGVRDIGLGNVELVPDLEDEELDDVLLDANTEGVMEQISHFTADTEIREDFEERQQIHAGSKALYESLQEHNSKSPELTAGDVDAAWEEANVGDETVSGLHSASTPDQDIVDNIGKAAGITYEDDEPLETVARIRERDVHRWELDPASAEDEEDEEEERN